MNKNYREYLKSNEWKEIKSLVLKRDGNKCIKCGSSNSLQIHHTTYVNIFNEVENLDDLITLCSKCHMEEHNIEVCINDSDDFALNINNEFIMQNTDMKPSSYILYLNILRLIQNAMIPNIQNKIEYNDIKCITFTREDISYVLNEQFYKKSVLNKIISNIIDNQSDNIIEDIKYENNKVHVFVDMDIFNKYFMCDTNYTVINIKNIIGIKNINCIKFIMLISRFKKNGWMKIKESDIRKLLGKESDLIKTKTLTRDIKSIMLQLDKKIKIKTFDVSDFRREKLYEFTFNKFKNTIGGAK